jgi:hypothetical protein
MELERRSEGLFDAIAHRWHAVESALLYEEACGPASILPLESDPTAEEEGAP